jgi:DNA-binding CsgD family transcriptional regulator/PAS domain-containing protein
VDIDTGVPLVDELFLLREEIRWYRSVLRSEIELRAIWERACFAVAVCTTGGVIVHANPFFALIHQREIRECIGEDLVLFHRSDQRERLKDLLAGVSAGESFSGVPLCYVRRDGTEAPVLSALFSLPPSQDQHGSIVVVSIPITLAEAPTAAPSVPSSTTTVSLLKDAQRLGRIGSWEYDIASRQIHWSDELYALLGWEVSLGPIPAGECRAIFGAAFDTFEAMARAVLRPGEKREWEFSLERAGVPRAFHCIVHSDATPDHAPTRLLGTFQDVTDRNRFEEEVAARDARLLSQNRELEQKTIALQELITQFRDAEDTFRHAVRETIQTEVIPLVHRRDFVRVEKALRALTSPMSTSAEPPTLAVLTQRELEVCRMIAKGFSSKQIADKLSISPQSVQTHRNHIRRKLGLLNKRMNLATFLQTSGASIHDLSVQNT